jgi:2-polyprenyl-3-methyl-5-hydroxy-6-metoxy-1,4-benzoquinol methylase
MEERVKQQLNDINRQFYQQFAQSFADTRVAPQPGFSKVEMYLPQECRNLLDVGCGEGRLGRFLLSRQRIKVYDGIDGSKALIEIAKSRVEGRFWHRDLSERGALTGLGKYDGITCLAVLQHIPGRRNRLRLMTEMAEHLSIRGRLVVSTWQFLDSERQRRKIVDWREVGLNPESLESTDYLLTWQRDGRGLRYVNYINEDEVLALASAAGLSTLTTFRADGREGNLNLYSVHQLN